MVAGLKERDFISNTFGRYVDQEIARELLSRPEASRMGGEKREVVILFSDVRGFTPLAESLSPEVIIHLVNRHFSRMIEVIQAHRGIIVDFLGDAILAFFRSPGRSTGTGGGSVHWLRFEDAGGGKSGEPGRTRLPSFTYRHRSPCR